jgi:hypothetical protein
MAKLRQTLLLSMAMAMTAIWGPRVERVCAGENELSTAISASTIIDLTHILRPGLPDFHEGAVAFTYEPLYTHFFDGKA